MWQSLFQRCPLAPVQHHWPCLWSFTKHSPQLGKAFAGLGCTTAKGCVLREMCELLALHKALRCTGAEDTDLDTSSPGSGHQSHQLWGCVGLIRAAPRAVQIQSTQLCDIRFIGATSRGPFQSPFGLDAVQKLLPSPPRCMCHPWRKCQFPKDFGNTYT